MSDEKLGGILCSGIRDLPDCYSQMFGDYEIVSENIIIVPEATSFLRALDMLRQHFKINGCGLWLDLLVIHLQSGEIYDRKMINSFFRGGIYPRETIFVSTEAKALSKWPQEGVCVERKEGKKRKKETMTLYFQKAITPLAIPSLVSDLLKRHFG